MLKNFYQKIRKIIQEKVWLKIKKFWRIILIIFLICLLLITFYLFDNLKNKQNLIVRFLDIGQGDSILITFRNTNFLIDAGPDDTVVNKLEKYLSFFRKKIDYVIPTHPDADHITGLINVFPKYKIDNVFTNGDMDQTTEVSTKINSEIKEEIEKSKAKLHNITCGDKLTFSNKENNEKLTMYFLHPIQNDLILNETNDNSIVILLVYGDYSFLFTGDISEAVENKLFFNIQKCFTFKDSENITENLNHLTILKVSHHGSKTASSQNFLKKIKPVYSIISVGENNRFGHPNPETIERLEKYSKYIIMTKDRGDITFITNGKDLKLEMTK